MERMTLALRKAGANTAREAEVSSGRIAQVKAFERLTVEAAVTGDRKAAYQALLAHPLGPEADQVQTVMDDLLETNKAFLPQFWD